METSSQKRVILFIVGMHRSGTSALTRAFCACGATTGDDVLHPVEGINSEGFWEDRNLVSLNEDLLHQNNLDWYSVGPHSQIIEASKSTHQKATQLLERGFGRGSVELAKDPRLCLTLPFWLQTCEDMDIGARICVIQRSAVEVAYSLEKRDGFPINYGYWLSKNYEKAIERTLTDVPTFASTTYDSLIKSPETVLSRLVEELKLPLEINPTALNNVINKNLKHHSDHDKESHSHNECDINKLLRDMTRAFVTRGIKLSRLGEEHSNALAIVEERDQQLANKNTQLEHLGKQHSHALNIVSLRDQELASSTEQNESLQRELVMHKSWINKIRFSLAKLVQRN